MNPSHSSDIREVPEEVQDIYQEIESIVDDLLRPHFTEETKFVVLAFVPPDEGEDVEGGALPATQCLIWGDTEFDIPAKLLACAHEQRQNSERGAVH